ncbi:DUF4268 domain-containing protein [Thermophilibacter provencensis]|uniref:DUF4268 domain-containing protein n=1 Tax=Thermophilibacter provencensis TaxID=1852386 RepID=UPI003AA80D28
MATKVQLGTIQQVDVRVVWQHEAQDFTTWLAQERNLAQLGEACSIDLEPVETESSVGSFSVDILAREAGTDRRVVIENQLEDTNHDHLGKLITYAAGKGAEIVIWVVNRARDEHRQAIEWLNAHTDDGCSFFLVEIEVLRIDDSAPAPRFNVVESPNEWARAEKTKSGLTDAKRMQLEYWQQFREAALSDAAFSRHMRAHAAEPQHWYMVNIGTSRCRLAALMNTRADKVGVEVVVPNDLPLGRALAEHAGEMGTELGVRPEPYAATKQSGVRFYLKHARVRDVDNWPALIAWQIESLVSLRVAVLAILEHGD